ncbi:ImmA/IrrE family metallo-endopeptidase [Burkholderia multivorans]|uniref:ImmA/IrrE family metallo-endopeptidase n=1 Tax=Burkholderia multivorans TaxID=87883 RepID=A0AAP2HMD6_9BURK|nr:ImmA/IrrE family metallo-endopeptidase [Burkholderia multivorans]MBU9359093.1 ImmA/IrrE family metallo-endopeptidase [Burkholderia multivorans]MBU9368850.1 ImmA/IrrE family metallo-endopeptidase [Burkholderia multivorans]HDR9017861.1 ImmA/IrrE family metallo-endopeptidase [Burkholderia vietnamiensis]
MTSLLLRLKLAKQRGEAVLADEKITDLPVDPFAIAQKYDIVVQAKPDTESGVSGMLLRHGNAFGILYASDIPNEGFQRFSVAHELGHYFLEGHIDHVLPNDGIHASHAGFSSGDSYEQEADNFAVGLLMPTKPFRKLMGRARLGLADIESAREACRTSLTSTAIRYAELTDDAIAVILSTGRVIDYCLLSEAMKSLPDLTWLKRGSPVPTNTVTARFNADGSRVARAERDEEEIDVLDWLGGKRSSIVKEEVIGLGRYGKTLTVLSSRKIGQEAYADEGDDEEDLVERWTPRFKK